MLSNPPKTTQYVRDRQGAQPILLPTNYSNHCVARIETENQDELPSNSD